MAFQSFITIIFFSFHLWCNFFKVLPSHMKVPPDHCKGPQATSKGHAPLLIPVSTMGECKQANEFQSRHYGHTTIYYSWAESSRFAIQCCPTKHDSSYAWIHPSILPSIHVHLLAMLGSWITVSKFLILASSVMLLNQPWHFNHDRVFFCLLQWCELIAQILQTLMEECTCFQLTMVRLEAGDCF